MASLLNKEEINTSRLYNLDLLKALAIVSMIFCHCVLMLGGYALRATAMTESKAKPCVTDAAPQALSCVPDIFQKHRIALID